jgi:hypothetical protein
MDIFLSGFACFRSLLVAGTFEDYFHLFPVQGFGLQKSFRKVTQERFFLQEDGMGSLVAILHQFAHFQVDVPGCNFAVGQRGCLISQKTVL